MSEENTPVADEVYIDSFGTKHILSYRNLPVNAKYREIYNFHINPLRDKYGSFAKVSCEIAQGDQRIVLDMEALKEVVDHLVASDATNPITVGDEYRCLSDNRQYKVLSVSLLTDEVTVGIHWEDSSESQKYINVEKLTASQFHDRFTLKGGPYASRYDLVVYR